MSAVFIEFRGLPPLQFTANERPWRQQRRLSPTALASEPLVVSFGRQLKFDQRTATTITDVA